MGTCSLYQKLRHLLNGIKEIKENAQKILLRLNVLSVQQINNFSPDCVSNQCFMNINVEDYCDKRPRTNYVPSKNKGGGNHTLEYVRFPSSSCRLPSLPPHPDSMPKV